MLTRFHPFVFVLFTTLAAEPGLAAPARAPVAAQAATPDAKPDKRPEVAQKLDKLKAHVDKKGTEDGDAIATIDELKKEFDNSGVKDRALIVTALSKCFEARRLNSDKDEVNDRLYKASATALGYMGPESVDALLKWIDHKDHRKNLSLQQLLVQALGRTKDKKALNPLIGYLQNKDAVIVGAAAQALGEFAGGELKPRKEAFEGMLKVLMSAHGTKESNVNDTTARERYDIISAPIITSLGKLSKVENVRQPNDWQTWWNKNKDKNWDAEK